MFDGKKIKEKRVSLKWSAEKLAKHLKVKAGNIYKWEKGIKPSDPEEYMRVINWLNDSKETVKPVNGVSDYWEKYFSLLEKYNTLLEKLVK